MYRRPADLDGAYLPFIKGTGVQIGLTDPVFRRKFHESTGTPVEDDILTASREWTATAFPGYSHTWEKLSLLKKHWDGPIVLKGIQHVEDAKLALEAGCDGIIVSNHGGELPLSHPFTLSHVLQSCPRSRSGPPGMDASRINPRRRG